MEKNTIRVICHEGYRADEYPVRFFLGSREVEVTRIIDRWMGEDHRYFKVLGSDGDKYILRHDTVEDTWELTMFDHTRL